MKKYKKAFTKIEWILTLSIVTGFLICAGVYYCRETADKNIVENLLYTYENLKQATEKYQQENGCPDAIAKCISKFQGENEWDYMDTSEHFQGIAKYLDIKDYACNNNYEGKEWLTNDTATLLDGSTQTEAWEAPTQAFKDAYTNANCYYLFNNGAVMHVQFPDNQRQSGFGSIDANGAKGPNRYGKDIFPIGWGAAGNPKHWAAKGLNPFWAEDGYATLPDDPGQNTDDYNFSGVQTGLYYRGMCRISCPNCFCKPDNASPTYYVLEYKKLPEYK